MSVIHDRLHFGRTRPALLLVIAATALIGCNSRESQRKPSLQITHIPPAGPGGPEHLDSIEGRASNARPGQQIILYARNGLWYIQPFRNRPITQIQADSSWKNSTHLGLEYAALLVESGYHPPSKTATLPTEGNGVLSVVTIKGRAAPPIIPKVIHFSGYDWNVRSAPSDRGGDLTSYDPSNVSLDAKGYLHLQMGQHEGQWSCGDVRLTRSLGYGTYKFTVQDSAHLGPFAVLGMFTWDEARDSETRSELDIELSRWGNPTSKNAQYVVQPYYVPENIVRFNAPPGPLIHVMHWEPGVASFKTIRGSKVGAASSTIKEHVFTSDVPIPGAETVHLDLYDFFHSKNGSQRPAEVVIEKFEYLP